MCDPSNPIAGGSCPIKDTGPPIVTYPLMDAIKNPKQLRSRREGSWNAIGDNVSAIDYYVKTLGTGPQYKGYGKRVVYDTGIKCSNMPGNAHKLADGTASGVGGYGLVPRMLGGLTGLIPGDIVSSATEEVMCSNLRLHYNTPAELLQMDQRGTDGIPASNKTSISGTRGVKYNLVDKLCAEGRLSPCIERPVSTQDTNEGFRLQTKRNEFQNGMYLLLALGVLGGIGFLLKRS